jgi:hypothetical protein
LNDSSATCSSNTSFLHLIFGSLVILVFVFLFFLLSLNIRGDIFILRQSLGNIYNRGNPSLLTFFV